MAHSPLVGGKGKKRNALADGELCCFYQQLIVGWVKKGESLPRGCQDEECRMHGAAGLAVPSIIARAAGRRKLLPAALPAPTPKRFLPLRPQPRLRILTPSPGEIGASKHMNQQTAAVISGGSDRYRVCQQQNTVSQEPCRKANKTHHLSPLPVFLWILVCSFILDDVSKKMLCAKPRGAQAPPLFAYRGGINPKPHKVRLLSALLNKSLAPSIHVGAKNPYTE